MFHIISGNLARFSYNSQFPLNPINFRKILLQGTLGTELGPLGVPVFVLDATPARGAS